MLKLTMAVAATTLLAAKPSETPELPQWVRVPGTLVAPIAEILSSFPLEDPSNRNASTRMARPSATGTGKSSPASARTVGSGCSSSTSCGRIQLAEPTQRASTRRSTGLSTGTWTTVESTAASAETNFSSAAANTSGRRCLASWYRPKTAHKRMWGRPLTAHRALKPGTLLRVSRGSKSVVVCVAGYGPASYTGRDLDLGDRAFTKLAPLSRGVIRVKYKVVEP